MICFLLATSSLPNLKQEITILILPKFNKLLKNILAATQQKVFFLRIKMAHWLPHIGNKKLLATNSWLPQTKKALLWVNSPWLSLTQWDGMMWTMSTWSQQFSERMRDANFWTLTIVNSLNFVTITNFTVIGMQQLSEDVVQVHLQELALSLNTLPILYALMKIINWKT